MELAEILRYKKELNYHKKKVNKESSKSTIEGQLVDINKLLLRNSGKYSLNVWVRIFQEELLKARQESWVLKTFRIKQERVTTTKEKLPVFYQTYICLVKNNTKLLKNTYSNEFLEYLLATKFKQTFNKRIHDHGSGIPSRLTYNFFTLNPKLIGDREASEARKTLNEQVNALIKLNNFMVIDVFPTTMEQDAASERALNSFDYKYLKGQKAILPSAKFFVKYKEFKNLKTPDEIIEKVVYDICRRNYNKNMKKEENAIKPIDFDELYKKDPRPWEL